MNKRIILLEVNEVPLRIFDQYCDWHPKSALARLLPRCHQYETYAEDVGNLSPWKTWPTLHRGVTNDQHLIADFGQDLTEQNRAYPPVWNLLARHGVKAGVCGSLHTYPPPRNYGGYSFFLPDSFAAGHESFPPKLELFQKFNLTMSRESARNVSGRIPWSDGAKLLADSPALGLRFSIYASVVGHLVEERTLPWKRTRRRTYQAVLTFDIFMKQLQATRPQFATFFTNHVASSQHRFWAAAFPQDYEQHGFDAEWIDTYRDEIDFAMGKVNEFAGRLVEFVDRNADYSLWIATSMGQAATEARALETQLYLVDPVKFTTALGLNSSDWESRPAMLPQWNVVVRPGKLAQFLEGLAKLHIEGEPIGYREAANGFISVDFGHANLHEQTDAIQFDGNVVSPQSLGLQHTEIEDKSSTTAYHIPQGSLFVYDGKEPKHKGRPQVSTTEIAPTILRNYAVPVPGYMRQPASIGA